MRCPACGASVDDEADLCLECGEPLGDSPAARVARAEARAGATASGVAATAAVGGPAARSGPRPIRRVEEPEPIRCPSCGIPSRAARCPGCGTRLREEE